MLLILAAILQSLLIFECVMRRFLLLFFHVRRTGLQKYADTTMFTTGIAAIAQACTLPLQALASVVSAVNRYLLLAIFIFVVFTMLLILGDNAIFVYSFVCRIYNSHVSPHLVYVKLTMAYLDIFFKLVTSFSNSILWAGKQILSRIIVPFSFGSFSLIPDMLQNVFSVLIATCNSLLILLQNVWDCSVEQPSTERECASNQFSSANLDCNGIFMPTNTKCFATPSHFQLDLITPGIYARQAALIFQRILILNCGIVAKILITATFPITDENLYFAIHSFVNTWLHLFIGLPIQTLRRCEAIQKQDIGFGFVTEFQKAIGCTPDWQPFFQYLNTFLDSAASVLDSWMNFAYVQLRTFLTGKLPTCSDVPVDVLEADYEASLGMEQLDLENVVLNAARAIEGRTVDDLLTLASRNGLPRSETLSKVRIIGVGDRIIAVTDGLAVLYRSIYSGFVLNYAAFPYHVDVRYGLASVSYSSSPIEFTPQDENQLGLIGCTCEDVKNGIRVHCATAPFLQQTSSVDFDGNEDTGTTFTNEATEEFAHSVVFPELDLIDMTCQSSIIRVVPYRFPRSRMSTAYSATKANTNFQNDGFSNLGSTFKDFVQQEVDQVDDLRKFANTKRSSNTAQIEALVYVQPVCSLQNANNLRCSKLHNGCFPFCMGLVKAGKRKQMITMHNAQRFNDYVYLPNIDCSVKDTGQSCVENEYANGDESLYENSLVENSQGFSKSRCSICTASLTHDANSFVPLTKLNAENTTKNSANQSKIEIISEHKKRAFAAVRLNEQPVVVAGDIFLHVTTEKPDNLPFSNNADLYQDDLFLSITRLYDVGNQGAFTMQSEKLTMLSSANAIRVTRCATRADDLCVRDAMAEGSVVLPASFGMITVTGATTSSLFIPAASSAWTVSFASNPELTVLEAYFNYCSGNLAQFAFIPTSSFDTARVWTIATVRAVDMEFDGRVSQEDVASRVSFFDVPNQFDRDSQHLNCETILNIRVVSLEYLNEDNILVTVLAAKMKDYDTIIADVRPDAHRIYNYYFLNPNKRNCVSTKDPNNAIYTCWRIEEDGMWPSDALIGGNLFSPSGLCPELSSIPAFGSFFAVIAKIYVEMACITVEAMTTFIACVNFDAINPTRALQKLFTVNTRNNMMHSMLDSAGTRLLNVEKLIEYSSSISMFMSSVLIQTFDALFGVGTSKKNENLGEKTGFGLKSIIIGQSHVMSASPETISIIAQLQKSVHTPIIAIAQSSSLAVLTATNGIGGVQLPLFITSLINVQVAFTSTLAMSMRIIRNMIIRFLQTTAEATNDIPDDEKIVVDNNAASIVMTTILESKDIIKNDYISLQRTQCAGFALMLGTDRAWGQAFKHACLLLPDTLETLLEVLTITLAEYPAISCACKLSENQQYIQDFVLKNTNTLPTSVDHVIALKTPASVVARICLSRSTPSHQKDWLQKIEFQTITNERLGLCYSTMDLVNNNFKHAFDKVFSRMYKMTQHISSTVHDILAVVLGEAASSCTAFEQSPYTVSIIPQPVDYFAQCSHSSDCKIKCVDEFEAFRIANESLFSGLQRAQTDKYPFFARDFTIPIESMLFSFEDVQMGRNRPPFNVLDADELSPIVCAKVCAKDTQWRSFAEAKSPNRCVILAGTYDVNTLSTQNPDDVGSQSTYVETNVAVAYYCLPVDITARVKQWPNFEVSDISSMQAQDYQLKPAYIHEDNHRFSEILLSVLIASAYSPLHEKRDWLITITKEKAVDADSESANAKTYIRLVYPHVTARQILRTADPTECLSSISFAQISNDNVDSYFSDIEHAVVDAANMPDRSTILYVYGMHREAPETQENDANQFNVNTCGLPVKKCLRAVIQPNLEKFAIEWRECSQQQQSIFAGAIATDDMLEFEQAATHQSVCIKFRSDFIVNTLDSIPKRKPGQDCINRLMLPRTRNAPDSANSAYLAIRTTEMGALTFTEHFVPLTSQTLAQFFVDSETSAYYSTLNQLHLRNILITKSIYLSDAEFETLQSTQSLNVQLVMVNAKYDGSFLHIFNLIVAQNRVKAQRRRGLLTETHVHVRASCSVENCGACGEDDSGRRRTDFQELQNLCFAAQSCALQRCAGTTVALNKPLCNLGQVITGDLHASRIIMHGAWTLIADSVTAAVELSEKRRRVFSVTWPDEEFLSFTCQMKDTIVSIASTITSILGAVAQIDFNLQKHQSMQSAQVDARTHARHIMTLASITNFLSSVALLPVYQLIVLQKMFSCTVDDVSLLITNLMQTAQTVLDSDNQQRQPEFMIQFGSKRVQDAISDAKFATCLAEDVRQSLQVIDSNSALFFDIYFVL